MCFVVSLEQYEKDTTEPVLLIVDELGRMDLGISHAGQLLLDYRPAMPDKSASEGSIIQRHIKCLRRYVSSQMPNVDASLSRIFVTGAQSERASLYNSIDEQRDLQRCHFPVAELCEGFDVEGELTEDAGLLAAIGLARHTPQETAASGTKNLMSTLRTSNQIPWLPLLREAWPIAASLLLAFSLMLVGNHRRSLAVQANEQIESLVGVNAEVRRMKFVLDKRQRRNSQAEAIKTSIGETRWAHVLWQTGAILPPQSWLDSVTINREGQLKLVGGIFTNEAIYQYMDQLKATGIYSRVSLEATNLSRLGSKRSYRFEISAQILSKTVQQSPPIATKTRSTNRG